ncbi:MAG: nucleotidyltransferase domain-containing protein [Firmicutes bacterium]|nr:nucleotidyltransferase domain-containing protein [Bacillota bacterium]
MGNAYVYTYDELQNVILPILHKYNADKGMLFGSYARKQATAESDIDLVVFGGSKFILTDIFAIAEELHRASGKKVDVYEISEINEGTAFYEAIMKEGVFLQ